MYVDIQIGIKTHGDVEEQVKGRTNGQRSLKFPFNQEIPDLYAVYVSFHNIPLGWRFGNHHHGRDDQIAF